MIICENAPTDPAKLFADHSGQLADDCKHKLRATGIRSDPTDSDAISYALQLIEESLKQRSKDLSDFQLPEPETRFNMYAAGSRLIAEETDYTADQTTTLRDTATPLLNESQRIVVNTVLNAVTLDTSRRQMFFLDGPGGTGKTFVENFILATLRSDGKICLAVASSGIASILLHGGRTGQSNSPILKPILT